MLIFHDIINTKLIDNKVNHDFYKLKGKPLCIKIFVRLNLGSELKGEPSSNPQYYFVFTQGFPKSLVNHILTT